MHTKKKVLLVDHDDSRRDTRVAMLVKAGYEVEVRFDHIASERIDHEARFDLMIVALHLHPEGAAAYTDRLTRMYPTLPILLLTDHGVFVPRGTLSQSIETGDPKELLIRVARMLTGEELIRELPITTGDNPSTQL